MEGIEHFLFTHGWMVLGALVAIVVLYVVLKGIIKFVLISVLIMLVVIGYLWVKDPERTTRNVGPEWKKAKERAGELFDKSQGAVRTGREILEKGKRIWEATPPPDTPRKAEPGGGEKSPGPETEERRPLKKG